MAEYIEREAIMEFPIRKDNCDKERANEHFIFGIESVLEYVQNLPAADVAPVVHGRWRALRKYDARRTYRCSVCGRTIRLSLAIDINEYAPYCNCGARMDGDDDAKAD